MKLLFATLLCLVVSVFGAPNPQKYYRPQTVKFSRLQANSKQFGKFNLDSRNAWTFKEKFKYYSVIKALLKVMETSTPAPEDVNTLLVLSRELAKELPENDQTFNGFGGIEIGIADMGLLDEGDAIVRVDGTPHIVTAYGAFPLSDVSLMTDEERETYLPTVKAFIKVLENDKIDQDDLDNLIEEGEKIQELMPDHWKAIISQTINENFVEEIGRARRNQEAIENARIKAQQQAQRSPVYSVRRPRKKSSPINKLFKGVTRHLSKTFG